MNHLQSLLAAYERGDTVEYSQGVYGDGVAILKDGQPMSPEEIVDTINQVSLLEIHRAAVAELRNALGRAEQYVALAAYQLKQTPQLCGQGADKCHDDIQKALEQTAQLAALEGLWRR